MKRNPYSVEYTRECLNSLVTLQKQRDELLAALDRIAYIGYAVTMDEIRSIACAAIAKVKR